MTAQSFVKFALLLLVAGTTLSCRDATAPSRLIVSGFDTATLKSPLIINNTSGLIVSWWVPVSATVTSMEGGLVATKAGSFEFSIDKSNFVVVDTQPVFITQVSAGEVRVQKNFSLRAVGGAGQIVTVTIWPEADPRLKKKIVVTPFAQ